MANENDMTGTYLASRDAAVMTPAQRLRLQDAQPERQARPAPVDLIPDTTSRSFLERAGAVAGDVALGVIEAPRQTLAGVLDATKELAQAMESVIPLGTLGGDEEPEFIEIEQQPRTVTGTAVRAISQFLTGFIPALKGIRAAGVTTAAAAPAAGAISDALVFDPQEERLSNMIQEVPELQNPVTEFLAAEPDDSDAEGRLKNAIEGLGLGAVTDAIFLGVKTLRASRLAKRAQAAEEAAQETAEEGVSGLPAVRETAEAADEGEFIPFQETMGSPEGRRFSVGGTPADPERALNINLSRIDTTEDVEQLIEGVAKSDAVRINEARREVITLAETEKLADQMGMTVEDLLARRQGEAFNAEQAVAARKLLVSSGENLIDMAKTAATGSEQEVAQFRRGLAQHRAIQAQVSGMTAEAGRALSSFRILAQSAEGQTRMIREALEAGGGIEYSKDLAEMVSQLEPHQVGTFVEQSLGARTQAAVYEAWINGLLSSPATHTVNALGNSMTAAWSVGERKVASWISRGLADDAIPEGETSAMLKGMVEGTKDGMKLAWDALKTGEPSDPIAKLETAGQRAISAEALQLSGTAGQFADFMGEVIRTPGRFLLAGDELFKSIGYRMELNAQAYKQAYNEGLRGESLGARMAEIVRNPPENLDLASVDASRYITFTRPLGEAGQSVQKAANKIPGARIILPFIRTPTNIIKYVGERTPLAPASKAVREEMAAGGARRDLALAKIATGSMVMAAAADFALSEDVTGAGPTNPAMKKLKMATGWQPYSIKVGDTYHAYNRLDPIGATIGIAADIAEIMGQTTEVEALDLATSATIAVAQNVTSKTYLSGLAQFFDVMSGTSADPQANNTKAIRWVERLAGSVVPAGVAQVERTLSPELSATDGIIEKLKSRIPGYSDDLPPRRNIFGEPIVLSGGLGPDIMSPIYTSIDKKDPVADEIVAQQTLLRMPRKVIGGVELTTQQYDEYIQLYAGKNNRFVQGRPLKTALRELFRSPQYRDATDGQEGGKSALIRATFEAYREAAKAAMLENDLELQIATIRAKTEQAAKLGATR